MKKTALCVTLSIVLGTIAFGAHAGQSTFDQFGGQPGIAKVVDDFVATVANDPRINHFFAHANIARLKEKLVEQICSATGGGCAYTGLSMTAAHSGMGVKSTDFNALVEDLMSAMKSDNIPTEAQNALLKELAPLKKDIVTQ